MKGEIYMEYHELLSMFYPFAKEADVSRVTFETIEKNTLVLTSYCSTYAEFEYEVKNFIIKSVSLLQNEKNTRVSSCVAKFVLNFVIVPNQAFAHVDFGCMINDVVVEQDIINHIEIGILQCPILQYNLNKKEQDEALAEFESMAMKNTDLN